MPVNAPHERAKRGRGGIYLVVVSTVGESAQFLNDRLGSTDPRLA